MDHMFREALSFNQPLPSFNTAKLTFVRLYLFGVNRAMRETRFSDFLFHIKLIIRWQIYSLVQRPSIRTCVILEPTDCLLCTAAFLRTLDALTQATQPVQLDRGVQLQLVPRSLLEWVLELKWYVYSKQIKKNRCIKTFLDVVCSFYSFSLLADPEGGSEC